MGQILGLGVTHYPGLGRKGNLAARMKSFMKDPQLPEQYRDPATWPEGEAVYETRVSTDTTGRAKARVGLVAGFYRARLETRDRFGKPVKAELPIRVLDPDAKHCALKLASLLAAPSWSVEVGEEFLALWGTGYERGAAFVEIEHRGRVLEAYWTSPGRTQSAIRQPASESMRGGFTIRVTFVRENRAYLYTQRVDVPWSNKRLTVKWEHFVSKLEPGGRETWTAVVAGPDATRAVAEMVATLYDASLDAYRPNGWPAGFGVFREEIAVEGGRFENGIAELRGMTHDWAIDSKDGSRTRSPSGTSSPFLRRRPSLTRNRLPTS